MLALVVGGKWSDGRLFPLQSCLESLCAHLKGRREAQTCLSGPPLLSQRWAASDALHPPPTRAGGSTHHCGGRAECKAAVETLLGGEDSSLSWGLWACACLNLVVFLPAALGSRDQSPAVVVTVVTISALLVLGSVMSVLAIWKR